MKYAILDAHINYFRQNGFIEFEDILSIQNLENLKNDLEKKSIMNTSFDSSRRDLFRSSDAIKKIAFNTTITSILKSLTKRQSLRLIFDQIFLKKDNTLKTFSLSPSTSFQGLIGGIIINIDPNQITSNNLNKKYSSIFINDTISINLENIFLDSEAFLLIAYGELKTVYKHNQSDHETNSIKKFGYSFGDVLKDETHPIVF